MEVKTIVTVMALALLAACSSAPQEDGTEPQALVKLATVRRQAVGETIRLYGVADSGPGGRADLFALIEARFVAIDAPVGSAVRQGQAIIRLAPGPTAMLDMAKARSDAQAADAAYARAVRMRGDGLMSDADVETARAAKASADATLASLTGRSLILRAPRAGYVESITGTPGDLIPAGTSIVAIGGAGAIRAHFGIDPALVRNLRAGTAIAISTAGSGHTIPARLSAVDPMVDPQTKLAAAYADLPAGAALRPGEALTGEATMQGAGDALAIPYTALLDDAGQPFVFVVVKGTAHRRDIVTGPSDGAAIVVTKGLSPGDKVVIEGGTALDDGMKVRLR
ncbi:MexH family multidrug efflux RND transporter periplasmic adaptor subunit [Sphingomonas bisphenolicum]|uniref:MexH family multidrug efflux RND transporter periplasmic adaptor subunit n=1 Tax=Sphingomonas bisphenolicum TaxID=296544 RepID=A0ABN5WAM7_9SPHN|nr:MexH family multidrug efflux RND transporter periplasmic adaptor subunit [Sphingomonas bisphenolicum]